MSPRLTSPAAAAAMEGAPEAGLKLFGMWASPFVHRVQLALKLKGLGYEYVEEDLSNKSSTLLFLNPVHEKVPVLLHGGRPIAESVVILEYVDETWTERYPLMPSDPLERAAVRFWCHFAENKLGPSIEAILTSTGEVQRAAAIEAVGNMKVLEDELREGFFRGRRFFGGDRVGFLDVVLGCVAPWLLVLEEVVGTDLVKVGRDFPCFVTWLRDFRAQAEVEEVIPASDKLVEYVRGLRRRMLSKQGYDEKKKP
ncbi:hypothetical protein Taro_042905 [Colocasia esculenta]|uniref:glutathione transferase n=1 Tax=Colocasia esculenta TaxID=4460 RepID=A0A843WQS2_COLES|nr:hypothetical protein [Colocasia esculenta]